MIEINLFEQFDYVLLLSTSKQDLACVFLFSYFRRDFLVNYNSTLISRKLFRENQKRLIIGVAVGELWKPAGLVLMCSVIRHKSNCSNTFISIIAAQFI